MVQIIRRTERESPAKQIYQSYLEGQERKRQKQQDALALQEKQYGRNLDAAKLYAQGYQFDPASGGISKRDDYVDYDQLNKQAEYELNQKRRQMIDEMEMSGSGGRVDAPTMVSQVPASPQVPVKGGLPTFSGKKYQYDPFSDKMNESDEYKIWLKTQEKIAEEKAVRQIEEEGQGEQIKDSAEDILGTIGEVEKGLDYFGFAGKAPSIPLITGDYAKRKNWEKNIDKLKAGLVLETLQKLKRASKTGSTVFGALSEGELKMLQDASTALGRELGKEDAAKYLSAMRQSFQKIVGNGQQQLATPEWVPQGFEGDYATAKSRGFSDDQILQKIKSLGL